MADYDPTKIDVSLSLLSGADSAAAKDLAKNLTAIAGHFESIDKSFESYGDKLDKIAEKLAKLTNQPTDEGGGSTPIKAQAHRDGVPPPGSTSRQARNALGEVLGRPRVGAMGGAAVGTGGRKSAYDTFGGASTPQGTRDPETKEVDQGMGPPLSPAARSNAALMGTGLSGRWISKAYNNAYARVAPGGKGESALGKVADVLGKGTGGFFDHEAQARLKGGQSSLLDEAMNDPLRAYFGFQAAQRGAKAAAAFVDPGLGEYERQARTLGYERGGQTSVGPFGFSVPGLQYLQGGTSGAEARHMKGVEIWARSHAGVNKEQAQNIMAETSASGLSGGMADSSVRLMTEMFGKRGMDPSVVKDFYGQLRTGTATWKDVTTQLDALATAAKGAGINVTQMAQQVAAAGEFNQSIGGTFAVGANKATAFTNATGLPPDRLQQLMQNPLVSGITTAQTGLPPQMQGLLGTAGALGGVNQAYKLAQRMSRGIGPSMASSHSIIDPKTGKPIMGANGKPVTEDITSKDVEDSFAASQLGMSLEEFRKYGRNMKRTEAATGLEAILQGKGKAHQAGWTQVASLGRQAGISQDTLHKIGQSDTYAERRKGIEKALADVNKGDQAKNANSVEIHLSKNAEKFFGLNLGKALHDVKRGVIQSGEGTMAEAANSVSGALGLGGNSHGLPGLGLGG